MNADLKARLTALEDQIVKLADENVQLSRRIDALEAKPHTAQQPAPALSTRDAIERAKGIATLEFVR